MSLSPPSDDFSVTTPSTRSAYLVGVYLGVNAIPDSAAVVDGPDCSFFKTEYIHGRHDLASTLLDVEGRHRIVVTHTNTDTIARSQGEAVVERLSSAARLPEVNLVVVTAMPMVSIIGLQYDQLVRDAGDTLAVDVATVPARSLNGDWLDGYEELLLALAKQLPRPASPPAPRQGRRVSIIGYLMDRNEGDHLGNVAELRRLAAALDLEVDSVWLSGRPWSELQRAAESDLLLALPLGRPAAAAIAEGSGARVLEVDTPFGLGETAAFMRQLGEATDRVEAAEAFIEAELREAVAPLEWIVPSFFVGLRVGISVTPDLLVGFHDLARELGMDVVELVSPARRPAWFDPTPLGKTPLGFDRRFSEEVWREAGEPDLLIADSSLLQGHGNPRVGLEFGLPSHRDHALFERPYLGYRGYRCLVQRILSALAVYGQRPREDD